MRDLTACEWDTILLRKTQQAREREAKRVLVERWAGSVALAARVEARLDSSGPALNVKG